MTDIAFVPLSDIAEAEIIELMNDARVGRHLPLLTNGFTAETCRAFLAAKQAMWDSHGYGPWAFRIDGAFAGWGGLQPERGDADFALVLHPGYWGWGRRIFEKVRKEAFDGMKLSSITILLPPDRPNTGALRRLGFVADGEMTIDGALFKRFRLWRR